MKRLTVLIVIGLLLSVVQSMASEVTNVEISHKDGATVARVDINGPIRFTHQTEIAKDGRPNRVILDVLSATHQLGAKEFMVLPNSPVKSLRTSQFSVTPEKIVRLVFDMKEELVYRVDSDSKSITIIFNHKALPYFKPWSTVATVAALKNVKKSSPKPVKVAQNNKPAIKTIASVKSSATATPKAVNKAIENDRLASLGTPLTPKKVTDKKSVTKTKPVKVIAKVEPKKTTPAPVKTVAKATPKKTTPAPVKTVAKVIPKKTTPAPVKTFAKVTPKKNAPAPVKTVAKATPKKTAPAPVKTVAKTAPEKPAKKKAVVVANKKVTKSTPTVASKKVAKKNVAKGNTQKALAAKVNSKSKTIAKKTAKKTSKADKKITQASKKNNKKSSKALAQSSSKSSSKATLRKKTSRFRRNTKSSDRIKGTMVAEFPKRLVIKYRTGGRADPFRTLVDQTRTYDDPIERRTANVEGLKLVGIIESLEGSNRALFEDNEGYSFMLKAGDKVKNGYVLRVDANKVHFQIFEYGWSRTIALRME